MLSSFLSKCIASHYLCTLLLKGCDSTVSSVFVCVRVCACVRACMCVCVRESVCGREGENNKYAQRTTVIPFAHYLYVLAGVVKCLKWRGRFATVPEKLA